MKANYDYLLIQMEDGDSYKIPSDKVLYVKVEDITENIVSTLHRMERIYSCEYFEVVMKNEDYISFCEISMNRRNKTCFENRMKLSQDIKLISFNLHNGRNASVQIQVPFRNRFNNREPRQNILQQCEYHEGDVDWLRIRIF